MTPSIYCSIQAIHAMLDRSAPLLRAVFEEFDSELLES
jgi:hypothetical protein